MVKGVVPMNIEKFVPLCDVQENEIVGVIEKSRYISLYRVKTVVDGLYGLYDYPEIDKNPNLKPTLFKPDSFKVVVFCHKE